MNRRRTLFARAAAAVFSLTLGAAVTTDADAGVSIHFSSGSSGHSHHQRPRYSHGVPFIKRKHLYGSHHHQPRHFRRHLHQHRSHGHRQRGRHVLGSGCSPATQRSRDHHGRLVINHVTVCHDRYGRPYVLGGAPGHN